MFTDAVQGEIRQNPNHTAVANIRNIAIFKTATAHRMARRQFE
jgi:hypothetical protein